MPYPAVLEQPAGSLLVITVAERAFVTRRSTPTRWTRPLRVAPERATAEADLYEPVVADAMRNLQLSELLVVDYTDDDDDIIRVDASCRSFSRGWSPAHSRNGRTLSRMRSQRPCFVLTTSCRRGNADTRPLRV